MFSLNIGSLGLLSSKDGGKCISSAAPCFESKKQLFVMETLDTGSFTAYDNADGADQTVVGSKFNLFADDAKQDPIRAYYFHLNEAHLMADSGGAEEFYYGTHEGEERKLMAYFDDGPTDNSVVSRWGMTKSFRCRAMSLRRLGAEPFWVSRTSSPAP